MKMKLCLPLLFADGQPTSLEKITQEQLEKFIPFMVSCCYAQEQRGQKPEWWPESSIPFQFPLRARGRKLQLTSLKEIVCLCYEFHKCEHALRFSARLSEIPPENLLYKEEDEGFVAIYNREGKLIVKFKKKVQTYDRVIPSPHKSLLPHKPQLPHSNPIIEDIYLCSYCDEEFTSGRDAVAHESLCRGQADEEVKETINIDQASVMRYFGLCQSSEAKDSNPIFKRGTSLRLTSRSFSSIPISSPLGAKLAVNVSQMEESDKLDYIFKIEKHCTHKKEISDHTKTRRPRRMGDSFYCSSVRRNQYVWCHTYCFNKKQREERRLTLQTGLNKKSRQLLKACKRASVIVEELPILDPVALHAAARLKFMQNIADNPLKRNLHSSVEQEREIDAGNTPRGEKKAETAIIDLCSSSEDGDNIDDSTNDGHSETSASMSEVKSFINQNDLNCVRHQCSKNFIPKSSFCRNYKLTQIQELDGPQYGVSARSSVSTSPLLIPATAEKHAHVPSHSASQNWLSSSNPPCVCDSVVCACSSQSMVPLRPIRI